MQPKLLCCVKEFISYGVDLDGQEANHICSRCNKLIWKIDLENNDRYGNLSAQCIHFSDLICKYKMISVFYLLIKLAYHFHILICELNYSSCKNLANPVSTY